MTAYTAEELARIVDGALLAPFAGPASAVPGGAVDSREIGEGEIFFAIAGERTDGHRFLDEAFRRGASFAVVDRERSARLPSSLPRDRMIAVADPESALIALAGERRSRFTPPVCAVSGSNGKTTVKELLAAIFSADGPTLASAGNRNTRIGLSLTLLRLDETHRRVVVELGISAPGEMELLGRLARPDSAVLTNVHAAHLDELGSVEGVAREKCVLLAHLEGEKKIFINGDDPVLLKEARRSGLPCRTFGFGEGCDVRAAGIEPWRKEGIRVTLPAAPSYSVSLYGRHNAANLLAALAVALDSGIGEETIRRGLAAFAPPAGRFRPERTGGVLIVDDTYNANLASTLGAIEFLQNVECPGKRILLLGDMYELGSREEADHREAGRAAALAPVDLLFLVGERVRWTAAEASGAGLALEKIVFAGGDRSGLGGKIAAALAPGDCLVAKGSRAMKIEEILAETREALTRPSAKKGN